MLVAALSPLLASSSAEGLPARFTQALAPDGNWMVQTNHQAPGGGGGGAASLDHITVPSTLSGNTLRSCEPRDPHVWPSPPTRSDRGSPSAVPESGEMHSGAEKGHACGSENGAVVLDGPILAGLGGLPAGYCGGGRGTRRASFIVEQRALALKEAAPRQMPRHLSGTMRAPKHAAPGRVELLSFDIWGRWVTWHPSPRCPR